MPKRASCPAPPRPPRSARSLCGTRASSPQPSKRLSTDSSGKLSISGSSDSARSQSTQATSVDEPEPCAKLSVEPLKPAVLPRDIEDRPALPVPAEEVAEIYASVRNLIADLRRDMGSRPETPRPTLVNDGVNKWLNDAAHLPEGGETPTVSTVLLSRRSSASSYSSTSSFVPTPTSSPGRSALVTPKTKAPNAELAQMQDRINDLQDENALLRAQLSLLAEQLTSRPLALSPVC